MSELSTAIILTVFLATCTTDIPDQISEDLEQEQESEGE